MQSDILFDNIYIGHSIEEAQKLKAETWDLKRPVEDAEEEATKPKVDDTPKSPLDLNFMDDPVLYVKEKTALFIDIAKRDPIEAIKFVPEVAGGIGVLAVTLIAVLVGAFTISGSSAAPAAKDAAKKTAEKAQEAKDKVAEAASSGAETVKTEVNKRTTRSSAAAAEAE